ncbi:peptidase M28 [Candidatus Koribacter versatilis Ellin345]|uniref:Peptidase M28 n=2 Tax=Candidatus Korobacter versatilis TaxID=658062 RepID=Q1IHI6_KORVE|nr:peptidase M28 [Candidatus Koribacter versatilis Ellin345]
MSREIPSCTLSVYLESLTAGGQEQRQILRALAQGCGNGIQPDVCRGKIRMSFVSRLNSACRTSVSLMLANAIGCGLVMFSGVSAVAQSKPVKKPSQVSPEIQAILRDVSAKQIEANINKLVSFGNRSTLSSDVPADSGKGITAAHEWIKSEFERYSKECGGCLEVKTDDFTESPMDRIPKPTQITNVYAVLKGTDPANADRIVLVTGHYDSRNSTNENTTDPAPGANDDGSGTAVSLECARVLSKHKFPATIIFLTVAGEEQGLNGSKHFAKMARAQGWQIEAALNNDIVGGNKTPGDTTQNPHTVRVFSEGVPANATEADLRLIRATGTENDSPSRELARYVGEVGKADLPKTFQPTLIYRRDRFLRGGDHSSFNMEGFAAVRFTEWREDFHHQHQNLRTENGIEYGDLPKFVDFEYVANVARLNAITLATLAMAPAPPDNARLQTKDLENGTTITWKPSPGGLATGYEVVWRNTSSPDWEESKGFPADANSAKIDVSKDNVIFGIRAVGKNGLKSPVVIPPPER